MNTREFEMAQILTELIENYGAIGLKTSFEDEGATFNEVIRLKEICNQSKAKINLKIGGPEAVRDMNDSTIIGVKGLVAPMVESKFGLEKFINAINIHIDKSIIPTLNLAINIETKTSIDNLSEILDSKSASELYAVTIGRADLSLSLDIPRAKINDEEMFQITRLAFKKIKCMGLSTTLGGGISIESYNFIKRLHDEGLIDNVETRYVMFDSTKLLKNFKKSLLKAQKFEYIWLNNKRTLNSNLADIDIDRINMIKNRISDSKE